MQGRSPYLHHGSGQYDSPHGEERHTESSRAPCYTTGLELVPDLVIVLKSRAN